MSVNVSKCQQWPQSFGASAFVCHKVSAHHQFTNASNDEFEEKGRHNSNGNGTEKPNE